MAPSKTQVVEIPQVRIDESEIILEGDTPLICHRMGEDAREDILRKAMKLPKKQRGPYDPQKAYEDSLYVSLAGWYGFPADGIKKSCISACRFIDGMAMTQARGAFFVIAQGTERGTRKPLVMLHGEPEIYEEIVNIRGSSVVRHRAWFDSWTATVPVRYNPNIITLEAVANLLEVAGFHIGIGDWRPEKNGTFGMFHVKRG